jgi:MFS family permease
VTAPRDFKEARMISREMILSLYLPAAVLALGNGIAAPVIPVYAKSFDISFGTASLILIVQGYGQVASTLPTGFLLDKLGRRPVLLAGPILTALSAFLTAFAGSFPELLLYRFLGGAASQMWNQTRLAMIADTGSDRQRGRMIIWMNNLQGLGMLIAPALGGFLGTIDLRAPFIAHGLLVLLALLPSFKLAKETASVETRSKPGSEAGEWRYVMSEVMKPQMLFFLLAQLLANLTRGNMQGIMNLYVAYAYDKGPQTLGLMGTANTALVLPISFCAGYVMDRFGRKKTIVPGFVGLFLAACFMAFTAISNASFEVFLLGFFMLNASQGLTAGNMQVLGADLSPARSRGRFFAVWRLIGEVGGATSPVAFSLLASMAYAASFGFIGVCALSVALLIGFKVRETVGGRPPLPDLGKPDAAASG